MALRFVGEVYSGRQSELLLPIIREESCNSEIMGGYPGPFLTLLGLSGVYMWVLFCNVIRGCGLDGLDLGLFHVWVRVDKGPRI